jgi:hypothetical protein
VGLVRRHPILSIVVALLAVAAGLLAVTGIAVFRAAHEDDASRVERADVIAVLGAAQYEGKASPVFVGRLARPAPIRPGACRHRARPGGRPAGRRLD